MEKTYFYKVSEQMQTKFWINNPTVNTAKQAIDEGAINCTTNPAYVSKLLGTDMEGQLMEAVRVAAASRADDHDAVDLVQSMMVEQIAEVFLPLSRENPTRNGFVSLQGNPYKDTDADNIIAEALRYRALKENIIPKIPATEAGLEAIDVLAKQNIPLIATEMMSIAQAKTVCERYMKATEGMAERPTMFVTHITGIFDEFLQKEAKSLGVDIDMALMKKAGTAVAALQYDYIKSQGYPVIMLGGGARDLYHFTNFVGWDMDITINWSTAEELIEKDYPVERVDVALTQEEIQELADKLPTFRQAYYGDLSVEEYEEYGPVGFFRDSFIEGWDMIVDLVRKAR